MLKPKLGTLTDGASGMTSWTCASVGRARGSDCASRRQSRLVDFFAVADFDDEHDVWGFDRVDDAPIFYTKPPCTLETVPQGLSKLDGVRAEFLFNGFADSAAKVLG